MSPLVKKWQLDEHESEPDIHHRKWSWADEEGWTKTVSIPLGPFKKYGGNPIFSTKAGSFYQTHIYRHSVVKHDKKYYICFTGYSSATVLQKIGLTCATSKTGPYQDGVMIIDPHAGHSQSGANLIFDEVDNLWRLLYGDYYYGQCHLGYAYCNGDDDPMNPNNWTISASNPVHNGTTTFVPSVGGGFLRLGNLFFFVYGDTTNNTLSVITTDDVEGTWTDRGVIVLADGAASIRFSSIFWNLGTMYLLYARNDGTNTDIYSAIGEAYGLKGFGTNDTFYIVPWNPVLAHEAGQWDADFVVSPNVIMENDEFFMWYAGRGSNFQIGLAKIPKW